MSTSSYVLFDLISGNALTGFSSERAAWQALREMAASDGPESLEHLSLVRVHDGTPTLIAMEEEIVRRVVQELRQEVIAS